MNGPGDTWLAHGRRLTDRAAWRLTAHFFRGMFDFGILSTAGADAFRRLLVGAVGGFVAFGLLLTDLHRSKYALLRGTSPESYRQAVLGDDLLLVGLPMLVVAFVTMLASHALLPDERDVRILGPLPLSRTAIFGAKLAALVLFSGLFITLAHVSLLPLALFVSLASPLGDHAVATRLAVWALTGAAASLFTVLAITAITGLLVVPLSRSRFHELTGFVRSVMLVLLVLCVPLLLRLPGFGASFASGAPWLQVVPPAWFVGLQQVLQGSEDPWFWHLARLAVAALGAAAAIVAIAYTVILRRFERLLLRPVAPPPHRPDVVRVPMSTRGTPAFRAVLWFTTLTLRRSPLHQGVLLGLSACGLGLALNGLVDTDPAAWWGTAVPPPSSLIAAAIWTPFGLMLVCGVGARAALALPMEHRANWIFRMTEDQATRHEQMRAVDRLVTAYVVGVPCAAAIPLLLIAIGSGAILAATVVVLVGLVFVHLVLLNWRRIPFTCSYLPGKRFVAHTIIRGVSAFVLFPLTGVAFLHVARAGTMQALTIVVALSVVAYGLWRRRLTIWRDTPLMFEDEPPDDPVQLNL